ncbi:hypothetical protein CBS101457_003415 [Exobasidium rhododendri]|nr:hypothetical protein CBS101457_003415 [Exobasidium rhododendri]
MGLFGKETEALPPHSSSDVQHRHILPEGKPRGIATENGLSFKEAGVQESAYKKEEYDPEQIWEEAKRGRNRETWGSVSSGSTSSGGTTDSSVSSGPASSGPSLMSKVKKELKKPLLA